MQWRPVVFFLAIFSAVCPAFAQPSHRVAVVEMNGQLAKTIPAFAFAEGRVTDMLNSKLAGQPGVTLVDRASIDKLIREQDLQNSDRSSPETAAKIGSLLGVGQIVIVNVYAGGFTTKAAPGFAKTKVMGTQTLRANVRLLNVESAAILAQPAAEFEDTALVGEFPNFPPRPPGPLPVDPALQEKEWNKACEAVTTDLATKVLAAIANAPGPKLPLASVAGIANGSVYIDEGSSAGVKSGDSFQIVRQVDTGLVGKDNKPILDRKKICVLTIANVNETNSSGSCQGGLPQKNDVAEPVKH